MSVLYSSVFGDLTRVVQARIDAASQAQVNLFGQTYFQDRLTWDTPSVGLNFEELIGKYDLGITAATVGDASKEPVRGHKGLETLAERVFKHAHTYPMTIQEYRKVLQLLDSRVLSDTQVKNELIRIMWGTVADAVNGVNSKLDMIFLGALSNEGKFEFNAKNNPEGGLQGVVDYKMPTENKFDAKIKWTAANSATVDVFEDLQAMQEAYADKSPIAEIWLSQSKLSYILKNKAIKQVIFGTDRTNSPLLVSGLNEFMQLNGMPTFRVIRRQIGVQDMSGAVSPYTPFNGKNLVFVPEGNLGVIKNAFADSELRPEPGVAYSNSGRIRISQWGVGETQGSNGVEFTKAESLSLPVITAINGIYSLKTED